MLQRGGAAGEGGGPARARGQEGAARGRGNRWARRERVQGDEARGGNEQGGAPRQAGRLKGRRQGERIAGCGGARGQGAVGIKAEGGNGGGTRGLRRGAKRG